MRVQARKCGSRQQGRKHHASKHHARRPARLHARMQARGPGSGDGFPPPSFFLCACACVPGCVHACVYACVYAHVRACVPGRVCTRVCVGSAGAAHIRKQPQKKMPQKKHHKKGRRTQAPRYPGTGGCGQRPGGENGAGTPPPRTHVVYTSALRYQTRPREEKTWQKFQLVTRLA